MKKAVIPSKGAKVVGPYSPGIKFGNLLFVAGQIGVDPKSGELKEGIKNQTMQTFENITAVLEEEGLDINNILKTTVYLQNMSDYAVMNEIYAKHFKEPFPARATVEVTRLPKGALIEIECIAYIKNEKENCCGGDCGSC